MRPNDRCFCSSGRKFKVRPFSCRSFCNLNAKDNLKRRETAYRCAAELTRGSWKTATMIKLVQYLLDMRMFNLDISAMRLVQTCEGLFALHFGLHMNVLRICGLHAIKIKPLNDTLHVF